MEATDPSGLLTSQPTSNGEFQVQQEMLSQKQSGEKQWEIFKINIWHSQTQVHLIPVNTCVSNTYKHKGGRN